MSRLLTIVLAGASLALASCATSKKECDTCDSKAKSDCCAKAAAAKTACATCDSTKKK